MFMTYSPTPFDISFRLLGFRVRVHPLFWLIMALIGDSNINNREIGPFALALWVFCGFVSILLHELGHAIFIRRFGSPTDIVLYGFGGFATMPYPPTQAWKRLVIALAGPFAGFSLVAVLVASQFAFNWRDVSPYLKYVLIFLFWMNLVWNILNLFPIYPLDGGRVCRELCAIFGFRNPDAISLRISVVTAVILAIYGLAGVVNVPMPVLDNILPFRPSLFMTFWLVLLAIESYNALQRVTRRTATWEDRLPWER